MTAGGTEIAGAGIVLDAGRYRRLMGNREAVAIISARTLSGLGDQAARLVLALYVLGAEGGGPLTAALVLALAYVPGTIGNAALGSLADRFPRRTVMLCADVVRALLVGVLALFVSFGQPLWMLLTLLLVVELVGPPAMAARRALLADVSRGPQEFTTANGLASSLDQIVQVVGFVFGAAAVQLLSATWALLFDAATFVVSFLLISVFVAARAAAAEAGTSPARMWADMVDGARALSGFPAVGAFVALTWSTAGLLAATHAVGLPYASDLGASDVVSGLVLAATPAGAAISALWVSHQHIRRQLMVMFPMAFASTVPLMLTVLKPGLTAVVALWFVGGLLQGYIVTAMAEVVNLTDPERRGRVVGVASAGFSAVAMVTIVGLGGLAELTSPAVTVAIAGVISLCLLIVLYVAWPTAAVSRALRDSYGMAPEPTSR